MLRDVEGAIPYGYFVHFHLNATRPPTLNYSITKHKKMLLHWNLSIPLRQQFFILWFPLHSG